MDKQIEYYKRQRGDQPAVKPTPPPVRQGRGIGFIDSQQGRALAVAAVLQIVLLIVAENYSSGFTFMSQLSMALEGNPRYISKLWWVFIPAYTVAIVYIARWVREGK